MTGMRLAGRLFDERFTAIRLAVVTLTGVAYLALAPEARVLSGLEWTLAVGVLAAGFAGIWSPFAVVCGTSAALAAGYLSGVDSDAVPAVALAWAMFELGARRYGWQIWCGLAFGVAATLLSGSSGAVEVALTVVYRMAAGLAAPLLLGLHVRTLRDLGRQAADRARQEVDRVRAEERASIARELHDLVAHHVASIVLRVAVARDVLPVDDPRVRQVLDDVHATGTGALTDLRRLVALLREAGAAQPPSVVDPSGLPVALRSAVDRSERIGLTVQVNIDPAIAGVDARTAHAMLRLTQEGLANVAKHAGTAARARLSIRRSGDRVEFDLQDFGGTSAPAVDSDGHGLIGLRERVEVLGGSLRAGATGTGWRLTALLPAGAAS
ncbi:sensor histidine kinase [Micromonospora sp. CPCC 206061]|uniref:sensor histidine kinase n=1 Tax=Micromonospora sp. CPCC 206061 TaxID=3122410 RepID=UPI002FF2AE87